jgi:hypothetical protein
MTSDKFFSLVRGVNVTVNKFTLIIYYSSQLANHIKSSDYFDKFSLLTHTIHSAAA